jgi:tight adherence protein C
MVLLAIIALVLGGIAVALVVRGIGLPFADVSARMRQIGSYGFGAVDSAPAALQSGAGATERPLSRVAQRVGDATAERLGGYEAMLRRQFVMAGMYRAQPRRFLGYQCLGAVAIAAIVVVAGSGNGLTSLLLALAAAAVAVAVPVFYVRVRARARRQAVNRAVPDLIDMLVVTIEAGLGFAASLQAASTRMSGPLGDELLLTMQEQRMGSSTAETLRHLQERTDAPNVHSFVRAVTQGETLGVSIGTIMRNLAQEMRIRRRQDAEERAQKAPVKMLFPLVFLMFPALGIVIIGPAVVEIFDKLGS